MYELKTTTGRILGLTDDPTFIRYHAPGCYVVTDELNAQGVSYHGTAYNLAGRDGVGAEETVCYPFRKVDAGDITSENIKAIAKQNERANAIEDALCEEDTAAAARLAAIEDALCELDKEES